MTPEGRRFPKEARLLRPREFDRVFRFRRSAAEGAIVLYGCPSAAGEGRASPLAAPARLGLSVSRRVGNAVVRNAWKRRLREAFRAVRGRLPAGQDFVVVVRPAPFPEGSEGVTRVEAALVALAARIVARAGHASGPPPGAGPRPRHR